MRKLLGVFVCLSVLLYSAVSFAYTVEVREHIPDKYMLVVVYGANPDKPIDEEEVKKLAYAAERNIVVDKTLSRAKEREISWLEQFQIAIYNEGKQFGDGIRAVINDGKMKESKPEKPFNEENELGYTITSDFFFADLQWDGLENSHDSETFYKNTTFFLIMFVKRIARDKHGTPFIEVERDELGFDYTARVYLKKDDPLLSTLRLEKAVGIRGRVTDFSNNLITLQGKIIRW